MNASRNLEFVSAKDIRALLERPEGPTISIYHPTSRVAVEPGEDSLRLKNLVKAAKGLLEEEGMRGPVAAKLLEPAVSLLENDGFWQHQFEGLAIFLDEQGRTHFRLPEKVREIVSVSTSPVIKPMLSSVFPSVEF